MSKAITKNVTNPCRAFEALKIKNITQKRLIFISKISYKLHSKMILLPISNLGIESLRNFFSAFHCCLFKF